MPPGRCLAGLQLLTLPGWGPTKLEHFPSVWRRSRSAAPVCVTAPITVVCPQKPAFGGESFGKASLKRIERGGVNEISSFPESTWPRDNQGRAERTLHPDTLWSPNEQPR